MGPKKGGKKKKDDGGDAGGGAETADQVQRTRIFIFFLRTNKYSPLQFEQAEWKSMKTEADRLHKATKREVNI